MTLSGSISEEVLVRNSSVCDRACKGPFALGGGGRGYIYTFGSQTE